MDLQHLLKKYFFGDAKRGLEGNCRAVLEVLGLVLSARAESTKVETTTTFDQSQMHVYGTTISRGANY